MLHAQMCDYILMSLAEWRARKYKGAIGMVYGTHVMHIENRKIGLWNRMQHET